MDTDLLNKGRFKHVEHLKRPADIQKIFRKGNSSSIYGAKIFYKENGTEFNRVGFPLPRGYGNAVERNRSKRCSREAYRFIKSRLNTGYDILFLIYPGNDSFLSRCDQITKLCEKAGLLKA